MRKSWLMCVLLAATAWGQAAPAGPPPNAPATAPDTSASVPADAPVITVVGVCPAPAKAAAPKTATAKTGTAATKTAAADCKTVITRAEFEKLASGVAPNITPQLKRQLAGVLPRLIAMSAVAQKRGLDKTPQYVETVKFAKMQILTNELQKSIQAEAAKVPESDVADFYKKNPEAYDQYNLDRLFIPRFKQPPPEPEGDKEEKLTDDQQKAKEEQEKARTAKSEAEMTSLAEALQKRAAAGEDFVQLQKEAFDAAGMKIETPSVNVPKVRRTGLPPGHSAVFDLKAGEISALISDTGGHYVYKVKEKVELPLAEVKEEIHAALQNQRMKDAMEKYQSSYHTDTNEAYFGPAPPQGMPPNPHSAVRPHAMTPPPSGGQPPAQPPASKPN